MLSTGIEGMHALVSAPLLPTPAAPAVRLLSWCVSKPTGGFFPFLLPGVVVLRPDAFMIQALDGVQGAQCPGGLVKRGASPAPHRP